MAENYEDDPGGTADLRRWPTWTLGETRGTRLRNLSAPAFLLFWLIEPTAEKVGDLRSPFLRAIVVASVVLYAASIIYALVRGPRHTRAGRIALIAWLYAAGSASVIIAKEPGELPMLAYAIAVAILLLPLGWARALGLATAVVTLAATWLVDGAVNWTSFLTLGLLTLALSSYTQLNRTVAQLRAAQARIGTLAAAAERARMARDLHDLLGHSLTTITFKTAFARRILESKDQPEKALEEVRDAELLSRQALTEIRTTVTGYRRLSLGTELVNVRAALESAGIRADLPQAVDNVDVHLQEHFSYVLREATTNVMRHSGATQCVVRLGETWLEVQDNGRGTAEPAGTERVGGNGIAGLAERMDLIGGHVEGAPLPQGGFLLRAWVTADEPATPGRRVTPAG
jgi:two-component system sensor histidine kinase DesK